jgi:multicomponent Na+:H+ antiporter subunit D
MSLLVALPILLPMTAFALGVVASRKPFVQTALALVVGFGLPAFGALLLAEAHRGTPLVLELGGWPSPLGIALVVDRFAALMVLLTGIVALAVTFYVLIELPNAERSRWLLPMMHLLLGGVCGAFSTGDLFNLYVWFEVMLIASFVLLGLGRSALGAEGALKYVVLNLVASTLFLAAAGVVYAMARSLSLGELSMRIPELASTHPELVMLVACLLFVAFGIKAGLFPLFFWLPASYHTLPVGVSALFAGLLTKVGVYAFVRIWTLFFSETPFAAQLVLVASGATMLAGVFGAVTQMHVRRILGFHIVSQIGYIVIGVGLLASRDPDVRRAALAAGLFYTAHHILVKTNLFLAGGVVQRLRGTEVLGKRGGLMETAPWLALLFAIPAASLAGIPPLSGFWAKLAILEASIDAKSYVIVAVALVAGLLTLASMVKVWTKAFWGAVPDDAEELRDPAARRGGRMLGLPMAFLAAMTVAIGLYPDPLFELVDAAAVELLDADAYRLALRVGP